MPDRNDNIIMAFIARHYDTIPVGVMHGFWFWFIFFFGLFSKDASVMIGLFSPRTQLFRCNNISYRLRIRE
jgi:hypothetical protein